MLWEIGGNNGFQAVLAGHAARPADRRLRRHGPRLSAGRHDDLLDLRAEALSLDHGRHPPQPHDLRGGRGLELDGAHDAAGLHRDRLVGRHLQGAAHRRARSRARTCLHTVTQALRIGRTVHVRRRKAHEDAVAAVVASGGRHGAVPRQDRRRACGAPPRAGCAARSRSTGSMPTDGHRMRIAFQNEFVGRLEGRGCLRHRAGPDLPDGQRLGRCHRHRDRALRPARHRHRPAGAGHPDERAGAQEGRPARLRLRPRFSVGVRGGAADDAHRHRRRRHQHGCRHDRRTAWCAMPSRARPPRTSPAASSRSLRRSAAPSPASTRVGDRRGDDRHHALHQRGGAAPQPRPGSRPCASGCRPRRRCRRSSTGRPICASSYAAPCTWCAAATRWTAGRSCRSTAPACARRRRPLPHPACGAAAVSCVFSPLNSDLEQRGRRDPARGMPAASPSPCRTSSAASVCWRARTCRCSTRR